MIMGKTRTILLLLIIITVAGCKGRGSGVTEKKEAMRENCIEGVQEHLDSIAANLLRIARPMPVIYECGEGEIELTPQQEKVKPKFYDVPASLSANAITLSQQYRAVAILAVDRVVAELYGMPDIYTPEIKRLTVSIGDDAILDMVNQESDVPYRERIAALYRSESDNGRSRFFWEALTAASVEQLYLIASCRDVFMESLTTEDVQNIAFHVNILTDALSDMASLEPDMAPLCRVIAPLETLTAFDKDEFREQMETIGDRVIEIRKDIMK